MNIIFARPFSHNTSMYTMYLLFYFSERNLNVNAIVICAGSEAVLGPPQPVCHQLTLTGVPLEQAVGRHRLRPGSGFLAVKIITDGPTSVLHISDIKEKVLMSPPSVSHIEMSGYMLSSCIYVYRIHMSGCACV
jgi:hypothetical protein